MAAAGILVHAGYHDQPINGKFNVVLKMISVGISYWILYEGGFFKPLFG